METIFGPPIVVEMPDGYEDYHAHVIGFVLDISGRQHDGRRLLDVLKEQLVKIIQSREGDDRVYIYHPNNETLPARHGSSVAQVSNYETPIPFNLRKALLTTMDIVAQEGRNSFQTIFYITDRYNGSDRHALDLSHMTRNSAKHKCRLVAVALSGRCENHLRLTSWTTVLVPKPQDLYPTIIKEIDAKDISIQN